MKKKVVRKVYECPECGSHRLLLRGTAEMTDLVRFDRPEHITYEWYDADNIDDDDPGSDYMCGSCEALPCIENEKELLEKTLKSHQFANSSFNRPTNMASPLTQPAPDTTHQCFNLFFFQFQK